MARETLINFIQSNTPGSSAAVVDIADNFQERFLSKNEYFLKAGRVSDEYLFLEEGCLRAFTHDTNGDEVTTYFYSKGRYVFEVSSLFMRTSSTESIQALTDCRGYSITFEQLNRLFHSSPEFREFGRMMLVKAFAAFKQRTLELINKSAEERYENLINTNKEVFQYAQLKHIASYLGVTDTSLSRIRREFAKKH
ncbi:Crp/Fnr family transcriptional regulator [Spirosoma luteum]|uniref:Crp/Fnr family transcriptional regulator n=1 Tax=Spirosoma luteum TaxID=431553 RepID=UPI0003823276|nr:Crp/Fnr family transcriptional regulator [Spirosoma luteum]